MKFNTYLECDEYINSLGTETSYVKYCVFDFTLNKPVWKLTQI